MYMPGGLTTGTRARLLSKMYPATDGHCMTFYYHSYKSGVGACLDGCYGLEVSPTLCFQPKIVQSSSEDAL